MTQARTALMRGELESAADLFKQAAHEEPNDHGAWLGLAEVRRRLNDPAGSLSALEQALRAQPENITALVGKADILDAQGKAKSAG
ncbi:MAG: tetratricopeptide repeat protein, partial [Pseudomonadota bacterium]